MMTYHNSAPAQPRVQVVLRGSIPLRAKEYAQQKLDALLHLSPMPVLQARVVLTRTRHRAPEEHVVAEAILDVSGRPVRAQLAAASSHEAIDLVQDRLRRKLSQLGKHPARFGGRERSHLPAYANRPAGEREVVSRKTYEPAVASAEEAAFDLELMDYDFQLFTDERSGVDSVIYRGGPEGYRLTRLASVPEDQPAASVPIEVDRWTAPHMTLQAAIGSLDATDLPFVFYADTATGRGNVLYRRHDGNYGLITPAS